jgi:hypothetical protein
MATSHIAVVSVDVIYSACRKRLMGLVMVPMRLPRQLQPAGLRLPRWSALQETCHPKSGCDRHTHDIVYATAQPRSEPRLQGPCDVFVRDQSKYARVEGSKKNKCALETIVIKSLLHKIKELENCDESREHVVVATLKLMNPVVRCGNRTGQ